MALDVIFPETAADQEVVPTMPIAVSVHRTDAEK